MAGSANIISFSDLQTAQAHVQKQKSGLDQVARCQRDLVGLVNVLESAALIVDERGRIIFANAALSAVMGLHPQEAYYQPWSTVLPFDERSRARFAACLGRRDGEPQELTLRLEGQPLRTVRVRCGGGGTEARCYVLVQLVGTAAQAPQEPSDWGIIGQGEAIVKVRRAIETLAPVRWPVLVTGETGTGKELVARALHRASPRAAGPFVVVNCAGLTDTLVTSELFGHRRGAFTGADRDHDGAFAQAHGGTLFLDEIGDMSPTAQRALLRVLEENEVRRLGDARPRQVDVRVVCATHRDLDAEVAAGRFRQDLLYRIRAMRIALPALRERPEDIAPLAAHFLSQAAAELSRELPPLSDAVLLAFEAHGWPGNVRELRAAIQHAVIHARQGRVTLRHLPPEIVTAEATERPMYIESPEHRELLAALERAGGSRTEAARILGVGRATLYRRLRKYAMT